MQLLKKPLVRYWNVFQLVNKFRFNENCWHVLLLVSSLLIIAIALWNDAYRPYGDFNVAYQAARKILLGTSPYEQGGFYIYPPFYAFLLTPLAKLPESIARWIWLSTNVVFIVFISMLAFRVLVYGFQLKVTGWQAIGACALTVLLTQDLILHVFAEGQNDLLILLGFVLALYWLDRQPFAAGIILGLIALIKYQALFFLPFLIFRARWRVVAGLIVGMVIAALLPAVIIGWHRNLEYLQIALQGFATIAQTSADGNTLAKIPSILWIGNMSISNGIARLFHAQGWPIQSAMIFVAIIAGLVFIFLWKTFQNSNVPFIWRSPLTLGNPQQETAIMNLEWSVLLLCMLIFSPNCARRHLVLLFGFNLMAVMMLLFPQPAIKRWPIVLAIVITLVAQCNFSWAIFPFNSFFLGRPGPYLGLPGWGYLIFLLIMTPKVLAYYRNVYGKPRFTS